LKYLDRNIKELADLEKTDSKRFEESAANILLSAFQITKKIVTQLDQ